MKKVAIVLFAVFCVAAWMGQARGVPLTPALVVVSHVDGVTVDIRQHRLNYGCGAGCEVFTFQNRVEITSPEGTYAHVYRVTAGDEYIAKSAGLLLAVATFADGTGFLTAADVEAYFHGIDPAFAIHDQRISPISNLGLSAARLLQLLQGSLGIAAGGACLHQFEADLFVGLQYSPNACMDACKLQ